MNRKTNLNQFAGRIAYAKKMGEIKDKERKLRNEKKSKGTD